jgi:hypothetical protein
MFYTYIYIYAYVYVCICVYYVCICIYINDIYISLSITNIYLSISLIILHDMVYNRIKSLEDHIRSLEPVILSERNLSSRNQELQVEIEDLKRNVLCSMNYIQDLKSQGIILEVELKNMKESLGAKCQEYERLFDRHYNTEKELNFVKMESTKNEVNRALNENMAMSWEENRQLRYLLNDGEAANGKSKRNRFLALVQLGVKSRDYRVLSKELEEIQQKYQQLLSKNRFLQLEFDSLRYERDSSNVNMRKSKETLSTYENKFHLVETELQRCRDKINTISSENSKLKKVASSLLEKKKLHAIEKSAMENALQSEKKTTKSVQLSLSIAERNIMGYETGRLNEEDKIQHKMSHLYWGQNNLYSRERRGEIKNAEGLDDYFLFEYIRQWITKLVHEKNVLVGNDSVVIVKPHVKEAFKTFLSKHLPKLIANTTMEKTSLTLFEQLQLSNMELGAKMSDNTALIKEASKNLNKSSKDLRVKTDAHVSPPVANIRSPVRLHTPGLSPTKTTSNSTSASPQKNPTKSGLNSLLGSPMLLPSQVKQSSPSHLDISCTINDNNNNNSIMDNQTGNITLGQNHSSLRFLRRK